MPRPQHPRDHVESDVGPRMPKMGVVVHGGAADVPRNPPRLPQLQRPQRGRQRVLDQHRAGMHAPGDARGAESGRGAQQHRGMRPSVVFTQHGMVLETMWLLAAGGALVVVGVAVGCYFACRRRDRRTSGDEEETTREVVAEENPLSEVVKQAKHDGEEEIADGVAEGGSSLSAALDLSITLFDKRMTSKFSSGISTDGVLRDGSRADTVKKALMELAREPTQLGQNVAQRLLLETFNLAERALVCYLKSFEVELARLAVTGRRDPCWPPSTVCGLQICKVAVTDSWAKAVKVSGAGSFRAALNRLITRDFHSVVVGDHCRHDNPQTRRALVVECTALLTQASHLLGKEYAEALAIYERRVDAALESAEGDIEANALLELDQALPDFFERYDLDQSGTINSLEELDYLCTNLMYSFGMYVTFPAADEVRLACEAEGLSDDNEWDLEQFTDWFHRTIRNRATVRWQAGPDGSGTPLSARVDYEF
eukprot:TRINITY_DN18174_c0_g2_i1.p1 TRINITY_DN18174_c0_g2~~TRINITY_DN18174_c0_g2_i1.p1  ORF type:complete len:483 (+),score=95.88 TRINITY_DN18174_c0_g2_i1:182-1630(+)